METEYKGSKNIYHLFFNTNTLFIGKVQYHFEALDSTNAYAKTMLSKSKPSEGTVISADFQGQGRGQIGSFWESAAGANLLLSIILYPTFLLARDQFLLNQAIALSIHDFVSAYCGTRTKIKWSNDIYIKDKKVSGMLIENTISMAGIQSSVVGVGININQDIFRSDAPNPTSFCLETAQQYDLDEMKKTLCKCMEARYLQLRAGKKEALQHNYLQHLYRYQEEAIYEVEGHRFRGKIIGLDEIGRLLLQVNGKSNTYGFKEIKFVI